jgi:Spy/CpxP family protein refolding chaperone
MKKSAISKLVMLGVALSALIWTPIHSQAREIKCKHVKEMREKLAQDLKLSPEKTKEFMAIGEKYDKIRRDALEKINKSLEKLKPLVDAEKTDEAQVKKLVTAINSAQAEFMSTYQSRRNEVMALLTPVQQGKYLVATWTRYQEMKGKYGHHQQKKGKPGAKEKQE